MAQVKGRGLMASKTGWLAPVALLAFIATPLAVSAVWWQSITRHRILAAAAFVAYCAIAGIRKFLAAVLERVSARWEDRFADRLDLALELAFGWIFPSFERKYLAYVEHSLRHSDLRGLPTTGARVPEFDEVFVDVSLASRPPQEIKSVIVPEFPPDLAGRRALGDFLGHADGSVLAVLGAPGSGKTALLRHTARQALLRRRRERRPASSRPADGVPRRHPARERRVPILLYLRQHTAAITQNGSVSLTALLRSTLSDLAGDEPSGWFERRLQAGDCVVLLDGLDEVARQEERTKVAEWVDKQVSIYRGNDFVITSRPQGYQLTGIGGAQALQVCGFTSAQVEQFVRNWYLAVERQGPDGDAEARASSGADDLLRRLEQAPALHDLTANPLLLTMIVNVQRYSDVLPGSRAKLYDEICQVMLWRHQKAKRLASKISGDKKEAVLRALAYTMMERQVSDLRRNDVLAEIRPLLRRTSPRVTAEDFLLDIEEGGLLVEREAEVYSFAHQTFQEYLAAAHIRDKGFVHVLEAAVGDPWWRETTLLYTARAAADPIINACLDAGTATALALAFDCADQGSDFAADLHDRLNAVLAYGSSADADPQRKRLITSVLLTRHLGQQVRGADGTLLCARPVTWDIYRLFQADRQQLAASSPPSDATETTVVVGMQGSDAAAFAHWASAIIGGNTTYRLPAAASLDKDLLQRLPVMPGGTVPGVWVEEDQAAPALWVPDDTAHRYKVTAAALAACVESDIASSAASRIALLLVRSLIEIRVLSFRLGSDNLSRALDLARDFARDLESARDLALT